MSRVKARPPGKTPFASDPHGQHLFLDVRYTGIHPLIVLAGELPLVRFGDETKCYARVESVIRWHEKELRDSGGRSGDRGVLEVLTKALEDFKAGRTTEQSKG